MVSRMACTNASATIAPPLHGPQRGFTYVMLLWWVAISGVMLMALAQSWTMAAKREREAELLFRGEQIRKAIEAYAQVPLTEQGSRLPMRLSDLLTDRRSGKVVRHLRRVWPDPVTGEDWGLIHSDDGGIVGVYSRSLATPLRAPAGIARYSEWRFQAELSTYKISRQQTVIHPS
jgi:type II secretory pathway pseudopilin PulG